MKKLVGMFVVVVLFLTALVPCQAVELLSGMGDTYALEEPEWPDKHWLFMDQEQISSYEARGWERYVGVLPTDEGNTRIIYHWLNESLPNKEEEQSVYVGSWVLSPQMSEQYENTYKVPAISMATLSKVEPYSSWYSEWYRDDVEADPPTTEMADSELVKYLFARWEFATYDMGYGSMAYLRTGNVTVYDTDEVLAHGDFEQEMPHW